ncbi:MAG TPA: ribonuclease R, partial [Candidatus Competibacter phosphatis]|nr:ribonuclease R [Candidatus Competibacter phosphatis]
MQAPHPARIIFRHPLAFLARVLRHFQANRGTLLASAVAYHALLSLIPLLILLLVALSNILEKTWLL